MLAVQRPSMGSSKPPNLDMPFGYSFDANTSNFPFPPPTAPGPSLLDDNESKFLDNFFDGVSSDQFDYNLFTNAPDGADAGFGWDELPPTFMGTTSSYGQQPEIGNHALPDINFNNSMSTHVKAEPPIPTTTSADVLAAAATYLQNGSNSRPHSMGDGTLFQGQDISRPPTNGHSRPQSMSHNTGTSTRQYPMSHGRASADEYPPENYFSDMVFGNQIHPIRQRRTIPKFDLKWGSDAAFGASQGSFLSPTDPDGAIERTQAQTLEGAFILDGPSAEASRTTSPQSHRRTKSLGHPTDDVDHEPSRPKKRRKSKFQEDEEDGEDDESPVPALAQPSGNKKRKPSKKGVEICRGRSSSRESARENLTEDQKRENHIRSEQKRRTLIREGFEDLGELVPGLRGGGFSKSAVLIMSADWLEDLIDGNQVLRERLDQMEGRS
ncbi:hypothetical protein LOCC1_G000370 [Lachnellula occidentalis]|uniref:BHLH domain-containing protein n=1 Tax=Lachnellula occidentalis TaxID=215460 RepID=A0A8H8UI68_9HELO|nr:hypothetical protein LOCC1_G000370 [Lachnellula occidentalis]